MTAPALLVFIVCYGLSFVVVMGFGEWFFVWLGLEINMFSFISMIYKSESWCCVESMYSYFFVQGLSSGLLLIFIYLGWGVEMPLMMSIAAGPFFFWFPGVLEGVGWVECMMLMTLQSFLPLVLLSGMIGWMVLIWGLVSMVVGTVGSYGQGLLSSLMAYSSVNHSGWMLVSQIFEEELWLVYFFVYALVVVFVILYFLAAGLDSVEEVGGGDWMVMFVFVVSMSGIPPFMGFMMKWFVLESMIMVSVFAAMVMIISSLVMIYVYMRILYDVILGGGVSVGWWVLEGWGMGFMMMLSVCGLMIMPLCVWCLM